MGSTWWTGVEVIFRQQPLLETFFLPLLILPLVVWLTYWDCLKGQPVSDDVLGIFAYDGKWQTPLSWHNVFKKFRWHFGLKPNPNKRWKEDKQPAYLPSASAHHRLNLWVFSGISVLLYLWLIHFLSTQVAFAAVLLWIVHPIGGQTVAWISGIGYVCSIFFMLVGLNYIWISQQYHWGATPLGMLMTFLGFGFWQWMAVEAQFATVGVTLILLIFHQWSFALLSGLIAIYGCSNTLREALNLRKKVFHEQQMGQSTKFYGRKLIVVLKTFAYNVRLIFFPKRLGLYHTFCYHYELPYIEHEDWQALLGAALLGGIGLGICVGSLPIRLGCVWIVAFLVLFLNWITANQFVVDRYVFLPTFGGCLLAALVTPSWLYWLIIGVALMRTWSHLPTYFSEEEFYRSNIYNFPTSEVAYGNLGVVLLNQGWIGTALDTWMRGIQLNIDYDVCWYNISSIFRMRGPTNPNYFPRFYNSLPKEVQEAALVKDVLRGHLHIARYCLERTIKSQTCHFPKQWEEELRAITQELNRPSGVGAPSANLVTPLLTPALT